MIFTSLSDRDVAALIQAIKEFLQNPDFAIPILGRYKNEENVEDRLNGAQYIPVFLSRTESLQVQYSSPIQ
jgi:hypothetical protein